VTRVLRDDAVLIGNLLGHLEEFADVTVIVVGEEQF